MNIAVILFFIITVPPAVSFAVVLYNFLFAFRIGKVKTGIAEWPLVSVLIPARNEENNIAACIYSVLDQSYRNIEVIVLDDNSTDRTFEIAAETFSGNDRVKIFRGGELPEGWLGKNRACHQLAGYARGDYFLFIDADVRLGSGAIESAVSVITKNSLSLLSVFPTQLMNNPGEKLVVPLMNWLLLSFLPLPLVHKSRSKSFAAANGQFMFFERNAYFSIGGHEKVKDKIVEDMELAREIKKSGLKMMTGLGGNSVFCGMYSSFSDAFMGFAKNFFPGFSVPSALFIILIMMLFLLFTFPLAAVFWHPIFLIPAALIFLSRVLISIMSRQSVMLNAILHIPQMIVMSAVGVYSVAAARFKTVLWKGRRL